MPYAFSSKLRNQSSDLNSHDGSCDASILDPISNTKKLALRSSHSEKVGVCSSRIRVMSNVRLENSPNPVLNSQHLQKRPSQAGYWETCPIHQGNIEEYGRSLCRLRVARCMFLHLQCPYKCLGDPPYGLCPSGSMCLMVWQAICCLYRR